MENLSTANVTDISSMIGALELGDHLTSHGDAVLETAASASCMPSNDVTCGKPPTIYRCIGDSALEAAGANVNLAPHTQMHPVCTN